MNPAIEFLDLEGCPEELRIPVQAAILGAVERRAEDSSHAELLGSAASLNFYRGDAWARLKRIDEDQIPTPPYDRDAVGAWWHAVTDAENVGGHLFAFPSAWDGSIQHLEDSRRQSDA